jgi:hypothetical protein
MILAAIERRWRQKPDLRLGQLLVNLYRAEHPTDPPHPLFNLADGKLLELLGPETDEEKRYIADEPAASLRGMREAMREPADRQRASQEVDERDDGQNRSGER